MRKRSDTMVGLDVGGLVNWSAVFVETIFESSFSFSCILFTTAFALNHVNKVFRAVNVMSNGSCFACGLECVRSKSILYVGARRATTAVLKRTQGGMLFCEGLRILACTRTLLRLLLRRKATIGADLNML